jgi:hypothetical protein
MTKTQLLARIDELLVACRGGGKEAADTFHAFTGAMTLMTSLYGTKSPQVAALVRRRDELQARTQGVPMSWDRLLRESVQGVLENLRQEAAADLLPSLDKRITSGVLADFVQLAREALGQTGDGPKNVAAVLAAAAYEDTLRRMAGAVGMERKLADVIDDLKNAGLLVQPQLSIALSFLKFRNQALHAEWETIQRGAVESVLALVQDLLLTHFGGSTA